MTRFENENGIRDMKVVDGIQKHCSHVVRIKSVKNKKVSFIFTYFITQNQQKTNFQNCGFLWIPPEIIKMFKF